MMDVDEALDVADDLGWDALAVLAAEVRRLRGEVAVLMRDRQELFEAAEAELERLRAVEERVHTGGPSWLQPYMQRWILGLDKERSA